MLAHIAPFIILSMALIEDLRTQKVRNTTIISFAVLALISQAVLFGFNGLMGGLFGAMVGLFVCLPLVLMKGLGAGDMKVLAVLGLATNWHVALWTAVFSLVWGALLGIFKAVLDGRGLNLLQNTVALLNKTTRSYVNVHRIPYTVALLLGWATYLSVNLRGLL